MASAEIVDRIITVLNKCNFSREQQKMVLTKISYFIKERADLEANICKYKNVLMNNGLSESEAIDTIINNPRYIWRSKESLEKAVLNIIKSVHRKNIKIVEDAIKEVDIDNYDSDAVFEFLINYGFSPNIINKDRRLGSILKCTDLDKIKRLIKFYESFGYSKEDIIKCGNKTLLFLVNGDDFFVRWFRFFEKYNIGPQEFMLMYKRNVFGFNYDEDHVDKVISWFTNFGFDNVHIKKTIIGQPSILNAVEDIYTEKFNNLMNVIGYTREQVIELVSNCPSILSNSKEVIVDKFNILLDYNFDFDSAVNITLGYPDYYSIGLSNIKDKLDAILDAGALDEIVNNPKNLIQGAKLTKERAWFMKNIKKIEDDSLYKKMLFAVKANFKRKMNIDSEELSNMYNRFVKKLELKCEE